MAKNKFVKNQCTFVKLRLKFFIAVSSLTILKTFFRETFNNGDERFKFLKIPLNYVLRKILP